MINIVSPFFTRDRKNDVLCDKILQAFPQFYFSKIILFDFPSSGFFFVVDLVLTWGALKGLSFVK
jgi:hypothetical protein